MYEAQFISGEEHEARYGHKPIEVEFLRAWDDNTWDTIIRSVPSSLKGESYDLLSQWYMGVYGEDEHHRKMVLVTVYNIP